MMPTLILSPRQTEDSRQLWRAAIQKGWLVERIQDWRVSEELRRCDEPVLYVESLMTPLVSEAFGVVLREPPEDWLVNLPDEHRLRRVVRMTLGESRRLQEPFFIKPPNDKSFPARVYAPDDLPTEYDDSMTVLVAEPVHWEIEYRCFLLDRRLKTFSVYLRDGVLQRDAGFVSTDEEDEQMQTFVAKVLADDRVSVPPAIVMDVGVIRHRGWAVVEINAAWGSGLYGCDPVGALDVIRAAVEKQ